MAQQMYQNGQLDVNINNFQRLIILFAGAHLYGVSTIGYYNNGSSMWVIDAEKYGDDSNPITCTFRYLAVIAHEFGHTVGFPDLHGVYQDTYGVGHYSLMGRNDPAVRMSPPVLDPYDQLQKGWLGYLMVNSPSYSPLANQYLPPVEETYNGGSPFVAVIPISGTPGQNGNWSQGEYFIIENRKVENFDRFLNVGDGGFQGGFLIWHWSTNTTLQNGLNLEVDEADGNFDMAKSFSAGAGNYGTPSDFWPGTTTNDVFSPWSTPNSRFGVNGAMTDVGSEVRSYDVNTGSYNVDLYYAGIVNASPSKPQNLVVTPYNGNPKLTWTRNEEPNIVNYKVYRDNIQIGTVIQPPSGTTSSFIDYDVTWAGNVSSGRSFTYKVQTVDNQNPALSSVYSDPYTVLYDPRLQKRSGSDTLISQSMPTVYELKQNYPNPFNPTTTIVYRVSQPGHVILKVYDMLGREVSTLVSEDEQAGVHTVAFDASRFASGMYFYRLVAPGINELRKMLVEE